MLARSRLGPEQDKFYQCYERAKARGWPVRVMEAEHAVHLSKPNELLPLLKATPAEVKPPTP